MKHFIPLQVMPIQDEGYHLSLQAKLGDTPVTLLVDTGASRTVFDEDIVKEIFALQEGDLKENTGPSGGIGTTSLQSSVAEIPLLKIGDIEITFYLAALIDLKAVNHLFSSIGLPGVEGILGGDLLVKYQAVIDYKKKCLCLYIRKKDQRKG
jgi:hypothetical protein